MSFLNELKRVQPHHLKAVTVRVRSTDGSAHFESKEGGRLVESSLAQEEQASHRDESFSRYGYIPNNAPDKDIAFVLPYLAFGSIEAADDTDLLKAHGITHVINLVSNTWIKQPPYDFHCLHLTMLDLSEYDLSNDLQICCNFIGQSLVTSIDSPQQQQQQQGKCFVHCVAGQSRSAAIVIGYVMQSHGMEFEQAYQLVSGVRDIALNAGFMRQLRQLLLLSSSQTQSGNN